MFKWHNADSAKIFFSSSMMNASKGSYMTCIVSASTLRWKSPIKRVVRSDVSIFAQNSGAVAGSNGLVIHAIGAYSN